jgi:MYXO-CTERM domain-containing protein
MAKTLGLLTPSLIFAALLLGSSSPAHADVAPPEPKEVTSPAPDQPATKTETKTDAKTETKSDTKSDTKTKSGNCSVESDNNQSVLGLAALVLLISAASLRRRTSKAV